MTFYLKFAAFFLDYASVTSDKRFDDLLGLVSHRIEKSETKYVALATTYTTRKAGAGGDRRLYYNGHLFDSSLHIGGKCFAFCDFSIKFQWFLLTLVVLFESADCLSSSRENWRFTRPLTRRMCTLKEWTPLAHPRFPDPATTQCYHSAAMKYCSLVFL